MILTLNVLRGINLLPMDTNILSSKSSDPYCEVHVNGKKIGWTPTEYATLNPVWGGPMSTFRIQGGGGTKIDIKIYDYDDLSADDPMGTVTFHVRDLLARASTDHYPNFWATVEPPEGYKDLPAGRLEIHLMEASDERDVSLFKEQVTVSPGPRLLDASRDSIRKSIALARTPVILHVYDVGNNAKVRGINSALPFIGMGGIFNGGIEVYGREYSFGGSPNNVCGVFACKPAGCPIHTYRDSIYLGDCCLDRHQVVAVLRRMKPEWMAPTYNLLRKNCCTFSNELATELGVGGIPDWVLALANIGAGLNAMMRNEIHRDNIHDPHELCTTWRSLDVKENHRKGLEDMTLDYVMAVRLQRTFRARHAKVEENGEPFEDNSSFVQIRRATLNQYEGNGFEMSQVQIRRATVNKYSGQGFEVAS